MALRDKLEAKASAYAEQPKSVNPIIGAADRMAEQPGERQAHEQRFEAGNDFLASDGVVYKIDEHNRLVNNYGHPAGEKYQVEFQRASGVRNWEQAKSQVPEVKELEDAWNALTPEEQAEYKSGLDATVAGVVSFIDNVLPVPGLSWAIGALNPELAQKIEFAAKANPEAANAGMIAGTVIGLIGGPLAFAKLLRGGVKAYGAYKSAEAGFKAASNIKKLISASKKVLKEHGTSNAQLSKHLKDDINFADDFLKDWRSYEKQNWTQDAVREALQNRINQEGKNNIVRRALGGGDDVFENFWSKQVAQTQKAGGRSKEILQNVTEAFAQKALNKYPFILESVALMGGDYAFNFWYSFTDWRTRGNSVEDSISLAFAFANDKTPQDVLTSAAGGSVDAVAPNSKFGKLVNALTQIGVVGARFGLLYPDLDTETGQVREDVYNEAYAANRGGLITSRRHPTGNIILGA